VSDENGVMAALITGGLGATIGTVLTAVIQLVSKRGESRAVAADRVTNAAGNLADRLDKINTDLEQENRHMREVMIALAEGVEELLPLALDEATRVKIRAAIKAARIAFR
jgi:seryl-tRNA synthetase